MKKYYVYMDMIGVNFDEHIIVSKGNIIEYIETKITSNDISIWFNVGYDYYKTDKVTFNNCTLPLDLEHIQKCLSGEIKTFMSKKDIEQLMVDMI